MYNSYYFKCESERERENLGNERKWVKDREAIRQSLKELSLPLSKLRLVGVSLSSLSHGYAYYLYQWVSVGLRVKVESGFYGWGQGLTVLH